MNDINERQKMCYDMIGLIQFIEKIEDDKHEGYQIKSYAEKIILFLLNHSKYETLKMIECITGDVKEAYEKYGDYIASDFAREFFTNYKNGTSKKLHYYQVNGLMGDDYLDSIKQKYLEDKIAFFK